MFKLVVEDFEEANVIRHAPDDYRYTNRGSHKILKDWGRFNFEWADLLKELFNAERFRETD